jgi:hypothetical protein
MKLALEILGALAILVYSIATFVIEYNRYGAADVLGFAVGWFLVVAACWLAGEFLHRVWRILRRHDTAFNAAE